MGSARGQRSAIMLGRSVTPLVLALLIVMGASHSLQSASAEGDTRTLTLHNIHTDANITITYRRNGHYVPSALKRLDWFLRDWRHNEETRMDPRLLDLLWQVYRAVDATQPIQIICGYRSPATNAMLHAHSRGVAMYSQHILGKAIDFSIPGVPLAKLRAVGIELQRGGVGFYPTSGSPFVHMDVGAVRHWPSIPRTQLVRIFPHGRTVHIPADGHPLSGYAVALAEIERQGNVPNARSLKAARAAGLITEKEEKVADLVGAARARPLIALVNSGRDNGVPKGHEGPVPAAVASLMPPQKPNAAALTRVALAKPVPLPQSRPQPVTVASLKTNEPAAAFDAKAIEPAPTPTEVAGLNADRPVQMTASIDNVFDRRFWQGPSQTASERPPNVPFELASVRPSITGSIVGTALAYAPTSTPRVRARPLGTALARLATAIRAKRMPANTTVVAKSSPRAISAQRITSPWLRAAVLTPSVRDDLTLTQIGEVNRGWPDKLLKKPRRAIMMAFSSDPQRGMISNRFTGHAIVFLNTTTFVRAQTASLED